MILRLRYPKTTASMSRLFLGLTTRLALRQTPWRSWISETPGTRHDIRISTNWMRNANTRATSESGSYVKNSFKRSCPRLTEGKPADTGQRQSPIPELVAGVRNLAAARYAKTMPTQSISRWTGSVSGQRHFVSMPGSVGSFSGA